MKLDYHKLAQDQIVEINQHNRQLGCGLKFMIDEDNDIYCVTKNDNEHRITLFNHRLTDREVCKILATLDNFTMLKVLDIKDLTEEIDQK